MRRQLRMFPTKAQCQRPMRQTTKTGRATPDTRTYSASVWQDGMMVAKVSGADPAAVRREAMHYAAVYAQDGPVQIRSRDYHALFGTPDTRDA